MKKIYIIGSIIIGIMVVTFVTAGLVNYLSNTFEANVEVFSPLTITTENTGSLVAYGGEVFITQATVVNEIDDEINGVFQATITNGLGTAICDDYQEITVDVMGGASGEGVDIPLMSLPNMGDDASYGCNDDGAITIIRIPVHYYGEEEQSYNLNLRFAQNVAPTNYNVEGQIMIEPAP